MSFNLRNIREISNEPLSKFVSHLAYRISKLQNDSQTQDLEDKEDIYSAGQDVDSVIKWHNLVSTKSFDFMTDYYPPFEPDLDTVRTWIKGDNLGNTLNDISGFKRHANLFGDPILIDGAPFDLGIYTGGVKSYALKFNRNEPQDYIVIPASTSGLSNRASEDLVTGASYFMRFRLDSREEDENGIKPRLFEKTDNTPINDGIIVAVDDVGRLRITIENDNVVHGKQTSSGVINVDTVYDMWITYNLSGNVIKCYVNDVEKSLSDTSQENYHSDQTNFDWYLMKRGKGSNSGYVQGDFYDFMLYRGKIVSASEVSRHYTNKWTTADIPFGQVMVANYYATYSAIASSSFTNTSFTSQSFTT